MDTIHQRSPWRIVHALRVALWPGPGRSRSSWRSTSALPWRLTSSPPGSTTGGLARQARRAGPLVGGSPARGFDRRARPTARHGRPAGSLLAAMPASSAPPASLQDRWLEGSRWERCRRDLGLLLVSCPSFRWPIG